MNYGSAVRRCCSTIGIYAVVTSYRSPLQNAHAERVIGAIRRECLDHLIVFGGDHARRILEEFVRCYDEERTHLALGGESPLPRESTPSSRGSVVTFPYLGGLHHSYRRAA